MFPLLVKYIVKKKVFTGSYLIILWQKLEMVANS